MTKQEFIDNLVKRRSQATAGLSDEILSEHFDAAIREYSERRPQEVTIRENTMNANGRHSVPSDFEDVSEVTDSYTGREIEWEIEVDPTTNEKTLVLGKVQVISSQFSTSIQYYHGPFRNSYPSESSQYGKYDLKYYRVIDIAQVPKTDLNKLVLYMEHLGYDYQSSNVREHVKFTDIDVDGEETTIDHASTGKMFVQLSDKKLKEFEKKLPIIFGTRDKTTEALYEQRQYKNYGYRRYY